MMAKDIINQYEESLGEIAKISVVLVVAVIFIFFISADALKALKRRAHWIPSDYLVLTALTIQQLNLLNGHGALLEEALKNPTPFQANILKSDFWMIHSSQVMLCVVIAYLVPGMACRGFEDSWGKLSALVITIVVHVTSEVYTVHQAHSKLTGYLYLWPRTSGTSHVVYIVLACIVSMSFLMLVLLLACATIAGKGIEGIIVQKIPQILSTPHIEEDFSWRTVEDDVLRTWIVARAYNPEYIIARSALSSSAAAIVTVQIVASIARWYMEGPSVELYDLFAVLKFTGTVLQQVFVCIGWAIIGWRWATAVGYYRRWHSDTWHSGFQMEDFWTRHIRELQEAQEPHLPEEKMLEKKVKKLITKEPKNMGIPRKLLYVVLGLQWLMVLFSKACWIGSLMIFHNKCMSKLLSFILSKHQKAAFEDYSKYRKILEGIQMLRETPASMWIANRKSIVQAKKIITQGNEDAEYNCQELIEFLAGKRTPIASSCIHISKPQTRLKHLGKKEDEQSQVMEKQLLDVEQHFADLSNIQSWKMTAVSLIRIIIQLSPIFVEDRDDACSTSHVFPPKAVQNCLKAYSQAWQIIDFVEETEAGGDQIISQAADKYFRRLRTKVENGSLPANKFRHATPKCVAAALNELAEECKKQTEPSSGVNIVSALLSLLGSKNGKEEVKTDIWERVGGNDSIDWKAAATGNAVYKLCKSIDCSSTCDVKELLKELECSLADTIYACILKVKPMLVLNSRKWARDSRENKIGRALYTAGKAKVLLEEMKRAEQREQVFRRDPNPLAIVID